MKILVLLFDKNIGGGQKAVKAISKSLAASGHSIKQVSIHDTGLPGVEWLGSRSIRTAIPKILESYKVHECKLLFTTLYGLGQAALACKILSVGKLRYVYREATNIQRSCNFVQKLLTHLIIKNSYRTTFNSRQQKRVYLKYYRNVSFVPNFYQEANLTRINNSCIVMVGRCDPVKRFELGLRRLVSLPGFSLKIFTTSTNLSYLHQIRELASDLNLQERVSIFVDITDKKTIYANEILYLASEFEGCANTVYEALTRGMPIIAENIDFGVKELLVGALGRVLRTDAPDKDFRIGVFELRNERSEEIKRQFESLNLNGLAKENLEKIFNDFKAY